MQPIEQLLAFLRDGIAEHDESSASFRAVYDEVLGLQQRLQRAEALLLRIRAVAIVPWCDEIDKLQIVSAENDESVYKGVRVYVRAGVEVRAYADRAEIGPQIFARV